MKSTNFERVQSEYNNGIYTLKDMVELVEKGVITEEEFHWITSYSYKGVKKNRGW